MNDTGKVLVIGSAVADIIIELDALPGRCEDVHVRSQTMRLGGCAYNVCDMLRHFKIPLIPFLPVGSGAYGDFVRAELAKRGIVSAAPSPKEENGCCYCFVEKDGERTFVSFHGAEYRFRKEWFDELSREQFDAVYICGLEIEENTGPVIIDFLEKRSDCRVFFAPGPRLLKISSERLQRILALRPILHLNETEAAQAAVLLGKGETSGAGESMHPEEAAEVLYALTGNAVVITLGADGCLIYDGDMVRHIPGERVRQVDTIGAGDSHIGALIAGLQKGFSLHRAAAAANRISAAVVQTEGALLSDESFQILEKHLLSGED